MAVVCKRACCETHSCLNLEEEVVDLSGDERENWCRVSSCACFCSYCVTDMCAVRLFLDASVALEYETK